MALGNPVELMLTPGQAHDLTCAEQLIDSADPEALLGDKAYDADPLIDTLAQRGITPVIPPKANRKAPRACDFALYCERNLIERFFNKLKHFRAIATRQCGAGGRIRRLSAAIVCRQIRRRRKACRRRGIYRDL